MKQWLLSGIIALGLFSSAQSQDTLEARISQIDNKSFLHQELPRVFRYGRVSDMSVVHEHYAIARQMLFRDSAALPDIFKKVTGIRLDEDELQRYYSLPGFTLSQGPVSSLQLIEARNQQPSFAGSVDEAAALLSRYAPHSAGRVLENVVLKVSHEVRAGDYGSGTIRINPAGGTVLGTLLHEIGHAYQDLACPDAYVGVVSGTIQFKSFDELLVYNEFAAEEYAWTVVREVYENNPSLGRELTQIIERRRRVTPLYGAFTGERFDVVCTVSSVPEFPDYFFKNTDDIYLFQLLLSADLASYESSLRLYVQAHRQDKDFFSE